MTPRAPGYGARTSASEPRPAGCKDAGSPWGWGEKAAATAERTEKKWGGRCNDHPKQSRKDQAMTHRASVLIAPTAPERKNSKGPLCPVCSGEGRLPRPRRRDLLGEVLALLERHDEPLQGREIAAILGVSEAVTLLILLTLWRRGEVVSVNGLDWRRKARA